MSSHRQFEIEGRTYETVILSKTDYPEDITRVLIPTYVSNELGLAVVRVCVQSILHFNEPEAEIWLIDNNSPMSFAQQLTEFDKRVNVILNRTEPLPLEGRGTYAWLRQIVDRRKRNWGSYANAIALEIGTRVIPSNSKYIMTLHMDTMASHQHWLQFFAEQVKCACWCGRRPYGPSTSCTRCASYIGGV